MERGRLVAIEGVDGAGTSTQAALLTEALRRQGFATHLTREPSDGPVGVLIRQILAGRVVVPGRTGPRIPRMETMALLFAADRVDHLESEIVPNLSDGVTIISDRYVHSSIAYQTVTARGDQGEALEWVKAVNSKARPPDLIILLQVSPEEADRRRQERGGRQEIFDDSDLQKRLAAFYAELPSRFPEQPFVVVDGGRPAAAVHADCLKVTLEHLGEERCYGT